MWRMQLVNRSLEGLNRSLPFSAFHVLGATWLLHLRGKKFSSSLIIFTVNAHIFAWMNPPRFELPMNNCLFALDPSTSYISFEHDVEF